MSSSVREKVVEQIREAKRLARGVSDAVEKGVQSANDKLEYIEAKVGGVSTKASSGDSPKPSPKKKKQPQKKKSQKPQRKNAGGPVRKFSRIARPQRFQGIF